MLRGTDSTGLPESEVRLDRTGTVGPAFAAYYDALLACDAVPERVIELSRLRTAQLLGCQDEAGGGNSGNGIGAVDAETVAALPRWPTDARFTDDERVCLAFVEQFLFDAGAVSDEQAARVRTVLGDRGFVAFVFALGVIEQRQRATLTLRALSGQAG